MLWLIALLVACESSINEEDDTGGGGTNDSDTETDSATQDTEDSDTEDSDTEDSDTGLVDTAVTDPDADGDGSPASEDCDDGDASSAPGFDELCDAVDHNCDGSETAGAIDAAFFYGDADDDGYGDANVLIEACSAPVGASSDNTDCDDDDAAVNPGATERCNGLDDDCDANTPEAGLADFEAGDGTVTDLTAQLGSGGVGAPVDYYTGGAGGTLSLCSGTYHVTFELGGDVDIVGIGGRDSVVIDANGSRPAVRHRHQSQTIGLSGLTVRNGDSQGDAGGGGLYLAAGNTANISDVVFKDNQGARGGAIYAPGSTVTISDSAFEGNSAAIAGGAIYLSNKATVTVTDSSFSSNVTEGSGGGFYLINVDSTFTGTGLSFTGNQPSDGHTEGAWNAATDPANVDCSYFECVVTSR